MSKLKHLAVFERPREKIHQRGAEVLSDEELLAVLLGSGNKSCDVMALSREVKKVVDEANDSLCIEKLCAISGIGTAKASLIVAALEFARRRIRPDGIQVRKASDVLPLLQHLALAKQEHFVAVTLNGAHEVIATRVITVGLANTTQVHPREVFADAITDRACALIVAHNHPSGDLKPSEADKEVTKTLAAAGKILGISLLDHIIISSRGFYSFQEASLMPQT